MSAASKRLALLGALLLTAGALFLLQGIRGDPGFVLSLRGVRLAQLCLVAHAVALATVLFQTVAGNRILTPSVMGFDALFVLVQTLLFHGIGALAATRLPPVPLFAAQVGAMLAFAALLYRRLFAGNDSPGRGLHLMMLAGIALGTAFHSVSRFVQGLIDPNEFVVLQGRLFADFSAVRVELLAPAALALTAATAAAAMQHRRLDVLALGRDAAIGLGVPYRRAVGAVIALVAVLVAVSTALVGPVAFFGLLVAHLACWLMPSHRHALVLPAASLTAMTLLVAGQWALERLLSFGTALAIVIEFAGGLLFLALLLRRKT